MVGNQEAPIYGAMLTWAISKSSLLTDDLAVELKVPVSTIIDWEKDQRRPTMSQLRKISDVLDFPPAMFFLSNPPQETSAQAFFREAIGDTEREPTQDEAQWIETARRLQELVSWISRRIEPRMPAIPQYSLSAAPDIVATNERQRMGITYSVQKGWGTPTEAFREWCSALDHAGISVMRLPMKRHAARGFAMWDDSAPIIAINTAYKWTEQRIFTLLHEYAHLLLRGTAVDGEDVWTPFKGIEEETETWCNRVAANMILPSQPLNEFLAQLKGGRYLRRVEMVRDFEVVKAIASEFKASLRAVAVRLIQLGIADEEIYEIVEERAEIRDYESGFGRSKKPRTRPRIRLEQFGRHIPGVLLEGMQRGVISEYDVVTSLNVKFSDILSLREELAQP